MVIGVDEERGKAVKISWVRTWRTGGFERRWWVVAERQVATVSLPAMMRREKVDSISGMVMPFSLLSLESDVLCWACRTGVMKSSRCFSRLRRRWILSRASW